MSSIRVAVTGASGFVGRALCIRLAAGGHVVVALTRSGVRVPGAETTSSIAGLTDREGLQRSFQGVDAVVHLAARVHVLRERAHDPLGAFRRVNVDGTRIVCEEAVRAGARRVVYVSSVKVHGEGKAEPYRESDALAPENAYGQSKLEAEQVVAAVVRGTASWTILRPPLVYGPGVGGNFQRLIRLASLARRVPVPLGGIRNRRSMVGVRNLAAALELSAHAPAAANQTYLVSDGEDLSTSQLIHQLALALGSRARLLPCPVGFLRALAGVTGRTAELDRLTGSLTVDNSALRGGPGWTPVVSVAEELRAVSDWWRSTR